MKNLNTYIKNIKRVEFTINNSCTSRCKHCSEGQLKANQVLDDKKAKGALETLAKAYDIQSIMTFGGEALIYPEKVCSIHQMAKTCGIPHRQLITNGCFSKNPTRIVEVVKMLEASGVNDLLLSVDCFHVEYLPLEWVRQFAEALVKYYTGDVHLQPSWVRSEEDDNPYNQKTRECLDYFKELQIEKNEGDIIFPGGKAAIYLAEYFEKKPIDLDFKCGMAPYSTPLDAIDELMINCNGDVLACIFPIGNINKQSILDIILQYDPYANEYTKALIEAGIKGLIQIARKKGIKIDLEKYYMPCEICKTIARTVSY